MKKKSPIRGSIIIQVALLFVVSVLLSGLITFISQKDFSEARVTRQTESTAAKISDEVKASVKEYPSYRWLLNYWYTHAEELDIEYDVNYHDGVKTQEKCRQLSEMYPGTQLKYATEKEVSALSEEGQKLFAEIAYSWMITRLNQIKSSYEVAFLFCVASDTANETQFFVLSAADPDSVRGTQYEQVYPLGVTVGVSEDQKEAMEHALLHITHLADAGNYVDFYSLLDVVDGRSYFIGLTLLNLDDSIFSETVSHSLTAMFYLICLAVICMTLIYLVVLVPLKDVQLNIRLYKETKNSEIVARNLEKIRPNNEIGHLSDDIASLACEMNEHIRNIRTITAEKERIGAELDMAAQIQSSMMPQIFPPYPDRHEFDIFASMDPAKEVGGDFYDFFMIDDDHLCLVIADVSGKGVPAALFMMASKIILQSCATHGESAADILTRTNETICRNNEMEMFVTVWLGILEISTGKLTAANAGHEYPVIRHPGGKFELMKDKHGFVIGGMSGLRYQEYELTLEPGSAIFLYTDGLAEATDAEDRMFGTARMTKALNELPEGTAEEIVTHMKENVDDFVQDAEQFDDLTMLCLRYLG